MKLTKWQVDKRASWLNSQAQRSAIMKSVGIPRFKSCGIPGTYAFKFLRLWLIPYHDKLECLSLTVTYTLVAGKAGAYLSATLAGLPLKLSSKHCLQILDWDGRGKHSSLVQVKKLKSFYGTGPGHNWLINLIFCVSTQQSNWK